MAKIIMNARTGKPVTREEVAARFERTKADIMHEIEGKHFGRCVDQVWAQGRMTLIELMDYPKAKTQAILVKRFDGPVPRPGSSKPWPDLCSAYVYLPIEDPSMTWESLDQALDAIESKI